MRVALVHDYLIQYGGAERVVEALHEAFPEAPLYTSIWDRHAFRGRWPGMEVRTSFLDRLPLAARLGQRWLLPLYPLAFERLRLQGFDVVISSASSFAKGIRVPPTTRHLCYCHAPTRFLWDYDAYAVAEGLPGLMRLGLRPLIGWLRRWDRAAARRVTRFVANSREIAGRIRAVYGRDAVVIPPPVDLTGLAGKVERGEHGLIVSRLVPAKRIDLAVRAFTLLGRPLVVVGDGRDRARLARLAGPRVQFAGWVPRDTLLEHYRRCRALIVPGPEDFGIATVEAQASGTPVVAFAGGGNLETVIGGETGVFFDHATPESLAEAVAELDRLDLSAARIRAHAEQFGTEAFVRRIRELAADASGAEAPREVMA